MNVQYTFALLFAVFFSINVQAQLGENKKSFTHQDTLRGSNGEYRQHWNVTHYDITVQPDIDNKTITGKCVMQFQDSGTFLMQIDLQQPMILDSVKNDDGYNLNFSREKNVYWLMFRDTNMRATIRIRPSLQSLTFYYHGKPKEAVRAPWDGGWVWKKDKNNNPFVTVACQGLGASVWYPCKDIQSDKPDSGATLQIIVPDSLVGIGNGKLVKKVPLNNGFSKYIWQVKNSINNYCIIPYIGKYVNFSEKYEGLKGNLDLDYWVLDYNLEKAKKQFADVPKMMQAFEYWFGAYPFYEDGYKLIDAPHLGMEHQSAVAYGNGYKMGYAGSDLSGTGVGLKWDFIIIHESGHEWFANNITTSDIADMWVHEGFTCYSETLFTEYHFGKEAANTYLQGLRKNIDNDKNIIGTYGVNEEGSGDMYYKGANMLHTIRQMVNNDNLFREMLIEMNQKFHKQTVTTKEIETYMSAKLKLDLSSIFNQYLRTTEIPVFEYKIEGRKFLFRWANTVENFYLPIKIFFNGKKMLVTPNKIWKTIKIKKCFSHETLIDKNYYINIKKSVK